MPPKKTAKKKPKIIKLNKEYDISLRTHERRTALVNDAKAYGTLKILKHLNTIRDYNQWNPRAHEIMTKDLEFLEKFYQKERRSSQN